METKPGYLTTEFWVSIFTAVFMFGNTVGIYDLIPEEWSATIMAIVAGLYTASRGLAKVNVKPDA